MVSSIRITTIFVILVIELLSVQNVNSFTATSSTTAATAARGRTVTANSGKLHRDCGSRSSNNGKSRLSMIRQHRRLIGQSALYAWGKDKELVTPPSTSNTMTTTPLFDDDGTGAAGVAAVVPTSDTEDNEDEAYKSAITKTLAWVAASAAFGTGLFFLSSPQTSEEFFAGYLLEQSLSVDNLLVFLLLFEYFKVPKAYQNRVLNWGIIGAIVMRAIMIGAGAVALQQFHAVLLVFAAILIYSSGKVLLGAGEDDDDEEEDLSQNAIVQFSNKLIASTDQFDGDRFFTFVDGVKMATPMLLCMVAVEFSDVVFAVDSIPAVFGVTENPLVVFTSNMFAIMGLRSLYTILSKAASELKYLEPAVAVVLGFIGVKLVLEYFGTCIPTEVSLLAVMSALSVGVGASLYEKRQEEEEGENK